MFWKHRFLIFWFAFICFAFSFPADTCSQSTENRTLQKQFDQRLEQVHAELIALRRDLHRHPEISGKEERTAGLLAAHLKKLGFNVTTGIGGYGVVAILEGGKPGPVVAFRADIDAVYSDFPDPVEFASVNNGVRHICGHDIHTAVGIALAEGFASVRDDLPGSVMLIFQPAEETASGARAMLEDDLFDEVEPEAIYAFHTAPFEVGLIGTKSGVLLPGRDRVHIALFSKDDLTESAKIIVDTIRNLNSVDPNTTSVSGDFISASIFHSQPYPQNDSWIIRASLTTSGEEMSSKANEDIRNALAALDRQGISHSFDYKERFVPGALNDNSLEQNSHHAIRSIVGDSGLVVLGGVPPGFSEDFGFFQEEVPGVMYYLGVSNSARGYVGLPHSPQYVADEESIFVGARVMFAVIFDFMQNN